MPCPNCGRSVVSGKQVCCRVRYCICNRCNHCHRGGICPDGKHWFVQKPQKGKRVHRPKVHPGQSHGGHAWIPGCKSRCHPCKK